MIPPSKSQTNTQDVGNFVSLHSTLYPEIDPSQTKLPQPYVVCIIGGRGAVGSSLAQSYAQAGATGIILGARSLALLEEVAHEVSAINPSTKTIIHECDITSSESVAALAARTASAFNSHLDLVVVNAGYSGPVVLDVVQEPPDQFQRAFDVNTIGTYHAAHHFLPLLLGTPHGGKSFLAISSLAAATVSGPLAHLRYCASKAAQTRVIEMVSEEYTQHGLFSATLHPGAMMSELSSVMPEEYQGMLSDDPNLVGAFCVWLTKEKNSKAREALNGRFLSCKWDVKELESRFDEILAKDLLRFRIAVE